MDFPGARSALEKWKMMLKEKPGWTAQSFEDGYRMWNLRDEDIVKLMEGIYKTGVLETEAKPGL
jgi:hypothetical protein